MTVIVVIILIFAPQPWRPGYVPPLTIQSYAIGKSAV